MEQFSPRLPTKSFSLAVCSNFISLPYLSFFFSFYLPHSQLRGKIFPLAKMHKSLFFVAHSISILHHFLREHLSPKAILLNIKRAHVRARKLGKTSRIGLTKCLDGLSHTLCRNPLVNIAQDCEIFREIVYLFHMFPKLVVCKLLKFKHSN